MVLSLRFIPIDRGLSPRFRNSRIIRWGRLRNSLLCGKNPGILKIEESGIWRITSILASLPPLDRCFHLAQEVVAKRTGIGDRLVKRVKRVPRVTRVTRVIREIAARDPVD